MATRSMWARACRAAFWQMLWSFSVALYFLTLPVQNPPERTPIIFLYSLGIWKSLSGCPALGNPAVVTHFTASAGIQHCHANSLSTLHPFCRFLNPSATSSPIPLEGVGRPKTDVMKEGWGASDEYLKHGCTPARLATCSSMLSAAKLGSFNQAHAAVGRACSQRDPLTH